MNRLEATEENMTTMVQYLQQTLNPVQIERRAAEKFLEGVEGYNNYSILLLTLVSQESMDMTVRQAAAITFKNFVKRSWRIIEGEPTKICAEDRGLIKKQIIDLMLSVPEQLQRQLSDAIGFIGREDFPYQWPDLMQQMTSKFLTGNFPVINGVSDSTLTFQKAAMVLICYIVGLAISDPRYRHEFKSNELWTEIKLVLDNFAKPLMDLFVATMSQLVTHEKDLNAVKILYSSLTLIAKVFYSLNYQDLPEFFEDNMETWMTHFLTLLTKDNPLLHTKDEDEAGPMEFLKSQVCDNVALYAQKYDEEFQPFLPNFVTAVWSLLISTGIQVKYDLLVSNAIGFLALVADRQQYKQLFESAEAMKQICEKIILPNMAFRDADEELFEMNAEEYIRRDIEGSDIDTRRRAACDLVRSLCKFFEAQVTQIFSGYVGVLLQNYSQDVTKNWKDKDTAIYLVTSLATKSKTQKHGTTEVSQLVNITDFFKSNIIQDLEAPSGPTREVLLSSLPCFMNLLKAESQVVHTYAASGIEKVVLVRHDGKQVITADDVKPHTEQLLNNLFGAFSHEGSSENEYVMKAILRVISLLKEFVNPYLPIILTTLKAKLMMVAKKIESVYKSHFKLSLDDKDIVFSYMTTQWCVRIHPVRISNHVDDAGNNETALNLCGALPFLLNHVLWERHGKSGTHQTRSSIYREGFKFHHCTRQTECLVFMSLYAAKNGGSALVEVVDSIQTKLFAMVLEKLYIADVQKVSGNLEKKICAIGMTKLLTECPAMLSPDYKQFWVPFLQALIGLFELPEDDSLPDDEHFIEIEDIEGYQTAYSKLAFAGKHETDPFKGAVPDAKVYLAQSLQKLSASQPGQIAPLISSKLDPKAAQFLQGYLQAAGVQLA
ncbi:Exportin-2 [Apostichopus japonicus]|uniref:Exportin-2 n=1 Tax=Stichopus japonicus TaxID=307972 RepID=A0A2G8K7K6_STIJA|nr:Exportin-2 [Apostichopus japonicus]